MLLYENHETNSLMILLKFFMNLITGGKHETQETQRSAGGAFELEWLHVIAIHSNSKNFNFWLKNTTSKRKIELENTIHKHTLIYFLNNYFCGSICAGYHRDFEDRKYYNGSIPEGHERFWNKRDFNTKRMVRFCIF